MVYRHLKTRSLQEHGNHTIRQQEQLHLLTHLLHLHLQGEAAVVHREAVAVVQVRVREAEINQSLKQVNPYEAF